MENKVVYECSDPEGCYNKINILLRMDFGYAEQLLIKNVMGYSVSIVTPAHIAYVAYKLHLKREYIADSAPIRSVDELEENEQDWDFDELCAEFPEVKEWENEMVVAAALYYRNKKVTQRREDLESTRKMLMEVCKGIAKEILEENNMLKK